jgi:hypothetical protein
MEGTLHVRVVATQQKLQEALTDRSCSPYNGDVTLDGLRVGGLTVGQ